MPSTDCNTTYSRPYIHVRTVHYKRVAVKGKFVFNTKEILELAKEVELEVSKGKLRKKRSIRVITPEIEDEEEEGIKEDIYESESDYIIVASSRAISK
jgi:hypothetical protein